MSLWRYTVHKNRSNKVIEIDGPVLANDYNEE